MIFEIISTTNIDLYNVIIIYYTKYSIDIIINNYLYNIIKDYNELRLDILFKINEFI